MSLEEAVIDTIKNSQASCGDKKQQCDQEHQCLPRSRRDQQQKHCDVAVIGVDRSSSRCRLCSRYRSNRRRWSQLVISRRSKQLAMSPVHDIAAIGEDLRNEEQRAIKELLRKRRAGRTQIKVLSSSQRRKADIILPMKKRYVSPRLSLKIYKLLATNQPQVSAHEVEDSKLWEESMQSLSAFNFTIQEADLILKKAFGWVHSPYWGEERKKEVPQLESIKLMLDYLKSLSLSDDDLRTILKKFPEVLGCCLDVELKPNVDTLERDWGIKGKTLRSLLCRNPKVLGYNVDCKGDCMAQCTRCWVRF